MNLLNAVVTKILGEPVYVDTYPEVKWWQLKIEYDCYGRLGEQCLTFKAENDAREVKVGYEFLT